MTYTKPSNITYTDICKWIDANAYSKDCDDVKLYEYLYHIVYMLAVKECMFKSGRDYDDFALMGATRLFMRLRNKKQFEDSSVDKRMPKIKSILNYTKKIMGPMRANYDKNRGTKSVDNQILPAEFLDVVTFQEQLRDTIEELSLVDFNCYMRDIPKTIKAYLKNIPQEKGTAQWDNIYLSCLLSIINSITLPNSTINDLKKVHIQTLKQKTIEKLYCENRKDCIILYHLPKDMEDYITVLINKVKRLIVKDLMGILHVYIPTNIGMENLMTSSIEDDFTYNNYE